MAIIAGLVAWLLNWLDADQIPGRHRGTGRSVRWFHRSKRVGTKSATILVQWLIAERQSPLPLSFVDFANEWAWREYEEWHTVRAAAGGW